MLELSGEFDRGLGARRPLAMAKQIRERLDALGFACIGSCGDDAFVAIARSLGEIVDDTPVRLKLGGRTYLTSPDAIPFHTDHPMADFVAWRCEAQDDSDGACLLLDGYDALAVLDPDDRAGLEQLLLPAMVRLGDTATPTPILATRVRRPSLFYAPWLEPVGKPLAGRRALATWRRALDRARPRAISLRLQPGQVLVVDNHRMLHGRAALRPDSARTLRRLWIRASSTIVAH